jgi:hypothetical protein
VAGNFRTHDGVDTPAFRREAEGGGNDFPAPPRDCGGAAAEALKLSGGLGGRVRVMVGVRARPGWAGTASTAAGTDCGGAVVKEGGVPRTSGRVLVPAVIVKEGRLPLRLHLL